MHAATLEPHGVEVDPDLGTRHCTLAVVAVADGSDPHQRAATVNGEADDIEADDIEAEPARVHAREHRDAADAPGGVPLVIRQQGITSSKACWREAGSWMRMHGRRGDRTWDEEDEAEADIDNGEVMGSVEGEARGGGGVEGAEDGGVVGHAL
jgi:hypothetical protein